MSSQGAVALLQANQAIVAKLSTMPPSNHPVLRALQVMTDKSRNLPMQVVSALLLAATLGHHDGELPMKILYVRLKKTPEMLTAFYYCVAGFHDKLGEGILTMILRSDRTGPRDRDGRSAHKYQQFRRWLVLPDTIKDSTKVPRLIKDEPEDNLDVKSKL